MPRDLQYHEMSSDELDQRASDSATEHKYATGSYRHSTLEHVKAQIANEKMRGGGKLRDAGGNEVSSSDEENFAKSWAAQSDRSTK